MSYYSYLYGKIQPSTIEHARASFDKQTSFTYMEVISHVNRLAVMKDQWGFIYKVYWPSDLSLNKGILYSFRGKLNKSDETIYDVDEIINHKGYRLKAYVSIFALIILCGFFYTRFSFDIKDIYIILKKGSNA